jgi:hypothetical protein
VSDVRVSDDLRSPQGNDLDGIKSIELAIAGRQLSEAGNIPRHTYRSKNVSDRGRCNCRPFCQSPYSRKYVIIRIEVRRSQNQHAGYNEVDYI